MYAHTYVRESKERSRGVQGDSCGWDRFGEFHGVSRVREF